MLGNSDVHEPSMHKSSETGDHRALTLVFAKEFTQDGIKEALNAARTAAWDRDRLIGREEHLAPLFEASIQVFAPHYRQWGRYWVEMKNSSHLTYELKRTGDVGPERITLEADASIIVRFESAEMNAAITLDYTAENVLIAPNKGLPVTLTIPMKP